MSNRHPSQAEKLFRVVSEDVMGVSIILLDAEGHVESWTAGAQRIEGYTAEEIIGKHCSVFMTEEDIARGLPEEWLHEAIAKGHVQTDGWRVRRGGERYWASVVLTAAHNDAGEVTGFVRLLRDATERLRAAQSLERSERYFRALIENAADVITIINEDGTVRYSSPALERLIGYAPEERLGKPVFELIHRDDQPSALRLFQQVRKEPSKIGSAVLRIKHSGGSWRYVQFRVRNLLRDPAVEGVIVNWHDVTEQIAAEQTLKAREHFLRDSEERFRKIVETSGEGIGIRDPAGKLTFVNQRMADMLGYTTDELIGRTIWDIIAPPYRDIMVESGERRRQTGQSEQLDIELVTKTGEHLSVILSASPLFDADGVYSGSLGMITDITERKLLEEQLRQSQKIEAVGRLAGGIAHDFNNLLTAIRGHVDLLLAEVPEGEAIRPDIQEIRKAADRAATLTQQLLAFSRRQLLQPRVIEIDQIVADMGPLLRRLIGEDIELITKLKSRLARVRADRGQIEQVLMNLVVNAREAMPNGGTVSVETDVVDLNSEFVRAYAGSHEGPHVSLVVSDTGVGMDETTLSHIFEPFFTTKGVGQGTGLGLAMVYGIVKQSGGYIRVDSEQGAGARFEILLPLVEEHVEVLPTPVAKPNGEVRGETVLVTEDEDAVRSLTVRILRKKGYKVLEARNGAEALDVARRHDGQIDLLLSDVVMPVLGGRELSERLLKLRPDVKVLFMSGYTDDALLQRGVSHGSGAFLEKPFTPDALTAKVRELLDSA